MELAIALATAGVLALIISAAIIPVVIMVSHRRQWYDIPNERKIHNNPIPRLGGIGIFFGLLLSAIAVPLLLPLLSPRPGPWVTRFTSYRCSSPSASFMAWVWPMISRISMPC